MNIKRAKEEIKSCIKAYLMKDEHGEYMLPAIRQRPILLMGPPGIGKTQIMEQIARECRVGLVSYTITHHTRQSAIGLPFIVEKEYGGRTYSVTEYTMSEIVASIYERMEETGLQEGILFIDEINCVSETLAPMMLQFLQCKTFGNHRIPQGWIIVTAGNPPEYNKSVREFDIATLDRIKKIDVEADFAVWKEYAILTAVHPAVIAYLEARPDHFYRIETTADGRRFATPRGWEDLARFLEIYEKLGKKVDRDVIYQYIEHPGIARDFAGYLELYEKYRTDYRIEKILSGEPAPEVAEQLSRASFDERFSVISLILSHLNSHFRAVCRKEAFLELLFEGLKKFRAADGTEGPSAVVRRLASELSAERESKLKCGFIGRYEDYLMRDTEGKLNEYALLLDREHIDTHDGAFRRLKERFDEETAEYDRMSECVLSLLEHGFDFLEAAFGAGQEMTIFVTELNTSYYSVRFLKENPCERYYQYNKTLLFEDRENDIRERLNQRT